MKFFLIFVGLLLLGSTTASGQTYRMRLVDKGNRVLGFQMQISAGTPPTTANQLLDLKFGVRWLASVGANLGTVAQNASGSYVIGKVGIETVKMASGTNYEFQSFTANSLPYNFPNNWTLNTWVDIMTVPLTGGTSIVNFDICPTPFDGTTDRNFNVDLTDYTPDIVSGAAMNLVIPLELISFEAETTEKQHVLLNWHTANESDMAAFELERSADAKDFTPLSKIAPKNGLQQFYTFEDAEPLKNISYYRLKMVNTDGSFKYSLIQSVELSKHQTPNSNVSPNPLKAGQLLHIETRATDSPTNLIMTDALGRVIQQSTIQSGDTWFPTSGLANGVYFLTCTSKNTQQTHKIVIQ